MNASYVQRGEYIDVVPENDVKAGDIVVRGRLVGVSKLDIKAGTLGALATTVRLLHRSEAHQRPRRRDWLQADQSPIFCPQ